MSTWELDESGYRQLAQSTPQRILYLVFDGLGDLPDEGDQTPLEKATTPNLDRLAREGCSGIFDPVAPGITPGSGPGHLGLFGYEPLTHLVGRGILGALGIDFELEPGDIAARGNFCTLEAGGNVVDRRAGRLPNEENRRVLAKLRLAFESVDLGCQVILETVSEHRFVVVFRGEGLGHEIADTDPQRTGVPPKAVVALGEGSRATAEIVQRFVDRVIETLADEPAANGCLLRGFDAKPALPTLSDRFKLRPVCIAQYPMYRGLARLVGMDVAAPPKDLSSMVDALKASWADHDFFFCHVKQTDKAGEDGDFDRKMRVIEEVDRLIPAMLELGPDVVVVTADHSTPASFAAHSYHPVPSLVWAPGRTRRDRVECFSDRAAESGGLGRLRLRHLLPIALANAGKLAKYGA